MKFKIGYISPCVSNNEKILAEAQLEMGEKNNFLDSDEMCQVLQTSDVFKDVKCSAKLGIAKIEHDGKTIILNRRGRISVREAKDKNDAVKTIKFLVDFLVKMGLLK